MAEDSDKPAGGATGTGRKAAADAPAKPRKAATPKAKPATKSAAKTAGGGAGRRAAAKPATKNPRGKTGAAAKAPAAPVSLRVMLWVAGAVLLLDQISKYVVVHLLRLDRVREIDLFPPFLNLRMAWNQGVNFGLFSSSQEIMRWVLIAVALGVCLWVVVWVWRSRPRAFAQAAAGLLVGGAIGNVIDRLTYGAVADFLNMSLPAWRNPYSFNVADIAIFAGAFGLILWPPGGKAGAADKNP
ncbi:signal peptidase II [Paracoccus jeotgali]|uniref:signal peptidase II n=1 Tax=Paracoccus jeotgali TaxID=2065379 RepID=UPI0028AC9734|nr:signal peptidase II [Paracoccus jeotgali]